MNEDKYEELETHKSFFLSLNEVDETLDLRLIQLLDHFPDLFIILSSDLFKSTPHPRYKKWIDNNEYISKCDYIITDSTESMISLSAFNIPVLWVPNDYDLIYLRMKEVLLRF